MSLKAWLSLFTARVIYISTWQQVLKPENQSQTSRQETAYSKRDKETTEISSLEPYSQSFKAAFLAG
jgi:hypothetical protein